MSELTKLITELIIVLFMGTSSILFITSGLMLLDQAIYAGMTPWVPIIIASAALACLCNDWFDSHTVCRGATND
jgi:hypothetical protein